ncbi:MAG TPA: hypothetical protein PKW28_02860 [Turneriella sp.]|nr:hypothetical protein [Turneriella sp.]
MGAADTVGFLAQILEQSSELFFSVPAALTVLLSREWYCARMTGERDSDILANFSLLSFMGLSLNGVAPGGLLRESAMPVLRFIHGQIWLLLLILVGVIYVLLKEPAPGSFSARFPLALIAQSWTLLLFNFIPVPPFDASVTYFASMMQWRFFSLLVILLSALTLFIFSYGFWRTDFLTGRFIAQWLKLV